MPPIEVLQLLPELDPGGAERIVLALARLLPRDRFHLSIAALDGRGELADEFHRLGCPVHDLGARGRWSRRAIRRLVGLIEQTQPAILHSHLLRAHLAAAWALRQLDLPLLVPDPVFIATEHQADPRRWAVMLTRLATRSAAAVVAVSEGVRQHLLKRGFDPARVQTITNGIDAEPIDRAAAIARPELAGMLALPAGTLEGARLAIFVGRLTRQKGLDVLLEAVSRLACGALPELHLLVVGDGPRREELQKLAAWLGLAEPRTGAARIHFLGRRDDVPQLLKSCDLAVLPSRWEGLSLVLLEAMAAGLPVVATRVAGSAETIEHETTGLLVPPEDAAALAAAIERVLADAPLAQHLGAAASQAARARHGDKSMAARHVELYAKSLETVTVNVA